MRSTADENGQVLKVSGVGPREELEKVGIKVVFELPGVGENLKDHLGIGMFFTYVSSCLRKLGLRFRAVRRRERVCSSLRTLWVVSVLSLSGCDTGRDP